MTLTEFNEKPFAENRRKEGYAEGFSKDVTKGFNDGVNKGIIEGVDETIKKMLSKGMSKNQVAYILEIPMERVDSIEADISKH